MQLTALSLALTRIGLGGFGVGSSLNLDFTSGNRTLDPRITFSRASNAMVTGPDGALQYAPHNLLTFSEQFDNAAWLKSNATVTANVISAPDGSTTADKIEATASAPTSLFQSLAFTGSACTGSVYVKKGSGANDANRFYIRDNTTATTLLAVAIDYDTRAITYVTGTTGADVVDVGNGWLRVTLSVASGLVSGNNLRFGVCFIGNNETAGEFAYAWGAQLNVGSLQPYYPTTVKNLLGFTQEFDNAAWTKSNSFVQTNLLTWSEQFDNAAWTKSNATVTANAAVAPDGAMTADKLVEDAASASHFARQNFTSTVGATYVSSAYIKAADRTSAIVIHYDGSVFAGVSVNLSTGVLSAPPVDLGLTDASATATVNSVGNGWYRVSISRAQVSTTTTQTRVAVQNGGNGVYTGDGTSGIYLWGAQLVQGSTPGDYQRTEGTARAVMYPAPDGSRTADKLVENTAAGNHLAVQTFATLTGARYTGSVRVRAGERSQIRLVMFDGAAAVAAYFDLATGTVGATLGAITPSIQSVGGGWFVCSGTFTSTATSSSGNMAVRTASAGSDSYTGDGTSGIYIWGAQLADSASLDPYVYNPGAAPAAAAYYGPRFDYDPVTLQPRGLLIEEQRTNSIRNNTMQGAVAGTPGTLPTNWTTLFNTTTGVNREVIGTGVEDGISYIDVRFSGTAVGAGSFDLFFEQANGVPALTGQPWSLGFFWRLVAGATTGLSSPIRYFYEYTSTQGFVAAQNVGALSFPSGLPLREQRVIGSATLSGGATTAFVRPLIKVNIANGAAIDITLRIGMPQLELGAFATSLIPTSGAAATRAADVAVMTGANFSNWYRQDEGTLFAEGSIPFVGGSTFPAFASFDDGTSSNAMEWSMWDAASDSVRFAVWNGGVNQASIVAGTYAAAAALKLAGAYKVNDFAASYNGASAVTDTAGTLPTVTVLRIGQNRAAGNPLNGHIRRIGFFPRRLSNAELQGITS